MKKTIIVVTLWPLYISGSGRVYNMWFSCLRFLHCCLLLLGVLLLAASPAQAEVKAGDILVVDQGRDALFLVDPTTGQRTVLSDFGNPAQGSLGATLGGVAVGASGRIFSKEGAGPNDDHGRIFVIDLGGSEPLLDGGALFEVDPDTGNRTLLSNFSQGNIHGYLYYGLAVNAKGKVIANLQTIDPPLYELDTAVVRVDPDTDERTVVTDLTNPRQGGPDEGIHRTFVGDLALERSGKILISTISRVEAIFRVQPETGKRKLLSDFTNAEQGVLASLFGFSGMAVETSGKILVNAYGTTEAADLILRIDPKTGQRTVLSNLKDSAQGTLCLAPVGLAVESSGDIVVGAYKNPTTNTESLFRVDSSTGQRTLLSDSDNPVQGPAFSAIAYIAVVPKDDHDHRLDHSNLQESLLTKVDSDAKEGTNRNDDQDPKDSDAEGPD